MKEEDKEEKVLYQVDYFWNDKAFPIDWNKLPDTVISKLKTDYLYTSLAYNKSELNYKTVVYFRKVKKFRKNITEIEQDSIVFGI